MKPKLQYLKYVIIHKWFVFVAGLKTGASIWLLLIHDWSKFLPSEFFPYAEFFYDKKKQETEGLDAIGLYGLAELAPYGFYVKDRFQCGLVVAPTKKSPPLAVLVFDARQ